MLLDVQMDLLLNMLLNMLLRLLELGLELWVRPVVREKLGACGAILQCPVGLGRRGGRRDGARLRNGTPRGGCGGGLREGIRVLGQSPRQLSAQVALALQQGPQAVGKLELALRGQREGRLLFAQAPVLPAATAGCLARVGVQPGWVRGPRQVAIPGQENEGSPHTLTAQHLSQRGRLANHERSSGTVKTSTVPRLMPSLLTLGSKLRVGGHACPSPPPTGTRNETFFQSCQLTLLEYSTKHRLTTLFIAVKD